MSGTWQRKRDKKRAPGEWSEMTEQGPKLRGSNGKEKIKNCGIAESFGGEK